MMDLLDDTFDPSLSDLEDEDRPTRMSSPDTSASSDHGRGAALVKRPWTPEEDALLIAAVHKYGAARWSMIATQLSTGRVGKQCRERWNNHLCPEVKKTEWSEEEDRSILQGVAVLGTRWCEIVKAPALVGRTDNAIKNRFYSLSRRMKARQCGGVRHGRRPAHVESEEERDPPNHAERIVAIATELAFSTDECERDHLIERLTAALHENQADDGCNLDDASDLGPLESPSSLEHLHALSSQLDGEQTLGEQPFEYTDADAAAAALFEQYEDPPTPAPVAMALPAPAVSDKGPANLAADVACLCTTAATAEAVASVSAVADLLHLPLSPRVDDTAPVAALSSATAAGFGQPQTKLPPSPSGESAACDDSASATTISPESTVGPAASLEEAAWRLPPSADSKRPLDSADHKKPFVRAATVVASPRADTTLTDKTGNALNGSAVGGGAVQPVPVCGSPRAMSFASGVQRARPVLAATDPSAATNNGPGGAVEPWQVVNVSATLLGGRQAYKACLGPLRLPAEDVSEVDSPKRMRTQSGAAPGAPHSRLSSSLRICAKPDSEYENAIPVLVHAGHAAVPPPTGEPIHSPMSELLSLSIFKDLFAEDGSALPPQSLPSLPGAAAPSSVKSAPLPPVAPTTDTAGVVSPETAPTTAPKTSSTPGGTAPRRSVRGNVRFATSVA